MFKSARSDLPLSLVATSAALSLVLVHTIAYVASSGLGAGFADAMSASGHGAWWLLLVLAVVLGFWAAVVAARSRSQFALSTAVVGAVGYARLVVLVWARLLVAAAAGFVLLENLESIASTGVASGIAPLALIVRDGALAPAALGVAAVAAGVVAVVYARRVAYADVLSASYADLVARGIFNADFQQPPWAVAFVRGVWDGALGDARPDRPLRVLECGCGSAFWLSAASAWAEGTAVRADLSAFDLSEAMVAAAVTRLEALGLTATVRTGDILDSASYRFGDSDVFGLVFAYDVVQQLPAAAQWAAITSMLGHVAPGGRLVVFDNDRRSRFGRVMGTKKWLRRYLGVPLVPAYYIHARYPDLDVIARELRRAGYDASVEVETLGRKRALVVGVPAASG